MSEQKRPDVPPGRSVQPAGSIDHPDGPPEGAPPVNPGGGQPETKTEGSIDHPDSDGEEGEKDKERGG